MKTNDLVRCLRSSDSNFLEKNKQYILVDENSFGNWRVQQNFGERLLSTHWYKTERFELIAVCKQTPAKPQKNISLGKKYKTRDGSFVKLFTVQSGDPRYPVLGTVTNINGECSNESWTADGRIYNDSDGKLIEDLMDLVEDIQEIKVFLSVNKTVTFYKDGSAILWMYNIGTTAFSKQDIDKLIEARAGLLK